jgi:hypothetical protein
MTPSTPIVNERKVIRFQAGVLALVIVLLAVSMCAAQWFAGHDHALLDHRLAEWKEKDGLYRDGRFYFDPEGRLLNEVLPHADYSRGGVYLLGSSVIQSGVRHWALPPEQQALIHNYGVSGESFNQQLHFVRYLVEQEGLLRAGGEKNSVIVGLFFGDAAHTVTKDPISIFRYLFTMDSLYSYDWEHGLERLPKSPAMWQLRLLQNRYRAFWRWAAMLTSGAEFDYLRPVRRRTAAENADFWLRRFGKNWEAGMDIELEQFALTIDYLRARHVTVQAVFMPTASWTLEFPPARRYRDKVLPLLSARAVSVVDLSRKAPDELFIDSAHVGYNGVRLLDPIIMDIARLDLRRMGLLR